MKEEHIILVSTGMLEIARKISPDVVVLNNGELNFVSKDTMAIPEIRQAVLAILGEADNGNI
jgi:ABC-2 type transport system ATP-binding protein